MVIIYATNDCRRTIIFPGHAMRGEAMLVYKIKTRPLHGENYCLICIILTFNLFQKTCNFAILRLYRQAKKQTKDIGYGTSKGRNFAGVMSLTLNWFILILANARARRRVLLQRHVASHLVNDQSGYTNN